MRGQENSASPRILSADFKCEKRMTRKTFIAWQFVSPLQDRNVAAYGLLWCGNALCKLIHRQARLPSHRKQGHSQRKIKVRL